MPGEMGRAAAAAAVIAPFSVNFLEVSVLQSHPPAPGALLLLRGEAQNPGALWAGRDLKAQPWAGTQHRRAAPGGNRVRHTGGDWEGG